MVSLATAGTDALWFLSQQGHLGRVTRGVPEPRVLPPNPPVDTLWLLADRRGRLYQKSVDGGFWQTDGASPWRAVDGGSIGRGILQSFAETDEGELWTVWGGRLVRIAGGPLIASVEVPPHGVSAYRAVGSGLWLGIEGGILRFRDGALDRLTVEPAIDGMVTAIEPVSATTIWVAARDGVSRLDQRADGRWARARLSLDAPHQVAVRSLMLDRQGSLWIGADGQGLYRVNRPPARRIGPAAGVSGIRAVATDGRGGAFVVSGCSGVFHLDTTGAVTAVPLADPDDRSGVVGDGCGTALASGGGGILWARAGRWLYRVRGRQTRRVAVELPNDEGPIAASPDGTVWVASRKGSLVRVAPDGTIVRRLDVAPSLISAVVAPDGALWVGGDGEVFRIGPDDVTTYGPEANVPRGLVRDVVPDVDGTVWIGTYGGGAGRLKAGRVARLTVEQGLPDNSISRILDDGRGRMWISTNRGLAVVDKVALDAVADGDARAIVPVVLGPERGVAEANFGSPAGFAGPDGRLWFGTIEGVAVIEAAAFPFNTRPPDVRVESILADERVLPLAELVQVPALTTRVQLRFTTFELLYPELMRFRFRIDGSAAGWIDAGTQRAVVWTPPGPGQYRVLVEARNEDGIWSAVPAAVRFDVLPAWWQTRTASAAGVVGLALVSGGIYRLRVRRIERRHAEHLRAVNEQRQAEQRLASMRTQLEHVSRVALAGELAASLAHEVRQPIGAIVNNAEAGKRHLAQYLRRPEDLEAIFADIVGDAMRASEVVRGLTGFLRSRDPDAASIDLSAVVREMLPLVRRELNDNHVSVTLSLGDGLPPVEGFRVALGQVVVNLVMNACEALADVPDDRRIEISTLTRSRHVELVVQDNGPGLPAHVASQVFEPFVTTKRDGLGMGLAICRSIAENHGGHLRADAVPGGGVRMVLSLPMVQAGECEP